MLRTSWNHVCPLAELFIMFNDRTNLQLFFSDYVMFL